MGRVVAISDPGVSGPQHLLIPDSVPPRDPYTIPTDVSLTLPPLTMNGYDGYYMKTTRNNTFLTPSGTSCPPNSYSSQTQRRRTHGSEPQDSALPLVLERYTPPYSTSRSRTSPAAYPPTPAPTMAEPGNDMSHVALPVRAAGGQRQFQQHAYYTPPYGSPVMPAPSSLLGTQIAQSPSSIDPRTTTTYQTQSFLLPVASSAFEYASTPFSAGPPSSSVAAFHTMPGPLPWHPSPYAETYVPAQTWQTSQFYRPARPATIFGTFPREVWERVFRWLPYADRLRLQTVNRFWRESLADLNWKIKASPSYDDFADMYSLVLQAENYRKHWAQSVAAECRTHRGRPRKNARKAMTAPESNDEDEGKRTSKKTSAGSEGSLGCYHCFTVRPPENFCLHADEDDENSYGRVREGRYAEDTGRERGAGGPRRYCIDCGIRKGYHKPGTYLERKWGVEVWICCHGYYEHGVMNCPKCGKGCPLTRKKRSSPAMLGPPTRAPKQARTATPSPLGRGQSPMSSTEGAKFPSAAPNAQSFHPWP